MTREEFLFNFSKTCSCFPNSPSVAVKSGPLSFEYLTYASLSSLSDKISASILDVVNSPTEITCFAINTNDKHFLVPIILGIWKAGFAVYPFNGFNFNKPRVEWQRCRYFFFGSKVDLLLESKNFTKICSVTIGNVEFDILENNSVSHLIDVKLDLSYCLTTSGSTGQPKSVYVPWSCIYLNILDLKSIFNIKDEDILLTITPATFDPFFVDLFCALISGATLLFVDLTVFNLNVFTSKNSQLNGEPIAISKNLWLPSKQPFFATFLQTTPSVFRKLFDINEVLGQDSSLRILVLGGEKFPNLNVTSTNCKIFNIYGITEISCWAFIHELKHLNLHSVPIGRPLNGIVYRIEDGELVIGSLRRCIIDGELPEDQDIVFRKTGDIVEVNSDTNELFYVARTNSIIKKFGMKVDLEQINIILSECNFLIDSSVVFEENLQIVGWFLVFRQSKIEKDWEELTPGKRSKLMKKLNCKLKAVEKPDNIIELKTMPLTSHGKKDLMGLKQLLLKCRSICMKRVKEFNFDLFKEAWCDVLGVQEISYEKTFIEQGGSSILAINLVSHPKLVGFKMPSNLLPLLLADGTLEKCCNLLSNATSYKKRKRVEYNGAITLSWTYDLEKCIDATPTIAFIQGSWCVVIGSHSGKLSAVLVDNGEELWTTRLGDRIEAGVCPSSDGTILAVGCYDQYIYGIASETGDILWKFRSGDMVKCTGRLSSDGCSIFVGSYDKKLYSIRMQDGNLIKSLQLSEGSILGRPATINEKLFIGTLDGSYLCLDAGTFNFYWRGKLDSPIFSSPCLLSRSQKVLFTEVKGIVHCFDISSGNKEWEFSCKGNIFSGMTPLEEEKYVTFGCHDCHLYLIRTEAPDRLVWKLQLDSPIHGTPANCDGQIVCSTTKGVVCLITMKGEIKANIQMTGEIFSSPIFWNSKIYVGCRNNTLACIDLALK